MGQSYGSRIIFLPALTCRDFSNMAYIPRGGPGKTICSGPRRRHGRQVHGSTDLAPRHHVRCPWDFLGLVNASRTGTVRNNERYLAFYADVREAFLEGIISCVLFFLYTFSRTIIENSVEAQGIHLRPGWRLEVIFLFVIHLHGGAAAYSCI
jgi:hypothetical protein